jgi:hypothetical protein
LAQNFWFLLLPFVLAIGVFFGLGMGWRKATDRDWVRGIGGVFTLQLLYAAVLVLIMGRYVTDRQSLGWPENLGGVPIAVPWFGAAGAVTISMSALSEHRHDWDPEWWFWHATRPLIGATIGTMAVLIFVAGILAVEQNPKTSGSPTSTSKFLYYVIAFAIGYREESFRELMKRVLDLLIKPGGSAAGAKVTRINPTSGRAGDDITIFGSGLSQVNSVTFDDHEAEIKSMNDTKLVVGVPKRPEGAGQAKVVVRTPNATFGAHEFEYVG